MTVFWNYDEVLGLTSSYYEGARVPWVPTREELLDIVMKLANISQDDIFYDLGCGDGRVVIKAVKEGAKKGVCVEINPTLIEKARENAKMEAVLNRIEFINEDFFRAPISDATIIYMLSLIHI